jgi:hypothetical protein
MLVSSIMIAETPHNSWSELLTSMVLSKEMSLIAKARRLDVL